MTKPPLQVGDIVDKDFNVIGRVRFSGDREIQVLEDLKTQAAQEAAAGLRPPQMSTYTDLNGLLCIDIPRIDGSGEQRFKSKDALGLVEVLAVSQWYSTRQIRKLNHALKERFSNDPDDFRVCENDPFSSIT